MKAIQYYTTVKEATNAILSVSKGFAAMYGSNLIVSDCKVDIEKIARDIAQLKKDHLAQYCTMEHPYKFYIAIRELGQEGSENRAYVLERCAHLGEPVFGMVFRYIHNEPIAVKFGSWEDWTK